MAGGKGTRFWPYSTEGKPKQFLPILSEETMIQQTYRRFLEWVPKEHIFVITARRYADILREQLPELDRERTILEPEQKDTGPCAALAALHFLSRGDDDVLVMAPSDQYIGDGEDLKKALLEAESAAQEFPAIVTLGIVPTRPETGYGYVEYSEKPRRGRLHRVQKFIEKPAPDKAEQLYRQPNTLWNSGIFVWKPSTIAHYMEKYQPALWYGLKKNRMRLEETYSALPGISIDYAVLEKAELIYTIPVDFGWDDVGLWTVLQRFRPSDPHGNIFLGDVHALECSDNIVCTEKNTVLVGVRDMIVVSWGDGLLVCHKSEEQKIKTALAEMGKKRRQIGAGGS